MTTQKDRVYHESAIIYNKELAEHAEELTSRIKDPTVRKWCQSVAKQHRFHEGRHTRALEKLNTHGGTTVETEDGGEDRVIDDEQFVHRSAIDGKYVSAEEAEDNPDTTVRETVKRYTGDALSPFVAKEEAADG